MRSPLDALQLKEYNQSLSILRLWTWAGGLGFILINHVS